MKNKSLYGLIAILFFTFLFPVKGECAEKEKQFETKSIDVLIQGDTLRLLPLADNAVRVQYKKGKSRKLPEWVYVGTSCPQYKVKENTETVEVQLEQMSVICEKLSGRLTFLNKKGQKIVSEIDTKLSPAVIQGENTYCAELHIDSPEDEALFGLGQFQDGYLDVRGLSRRLTQVNTQISIPFFYSSRGFGLLWNNYGMTEFNPADQKVEFQKKGAVGDKVTVNVTSTEGGKAEVRESNVFVSTLTVPEKGKYALLLDVGQKMARSHHLEIDGKKVLEMKNLWLPPTASTIVELEAGTHQLQARLEKDDKPVLYYKKVDNETVLRSPVAACVDYTIFIGEADDVIASYRNLTGNAPLIPQWALGYIHCRERFHSQDEILATTKKFRENKLPLDLIVQDWQYWGRYGWNAMRFDESFYPDPKKLVDELHAMNTRLMLSVWSKIDPQSEVGKEMMQKGYYIDQTSWIDFFNPNAAASYWSNFSNRLLKPYGIDAWWQDATEPENDDLEGRKVMDNTLPGEFVRNIYPLMVNKTVYEGSRKDAPEHRTMILTRSGFSGIQRYGAALWSGDVGNDWETLRRQITGGLSLMTSGIPWWTYDAGGFFRPYNQYNDPRFHERFIRWLQISTFLPLMRVHGYMTDTEFWNYGEEVVRLASYSLNLRYRLLPYIYSENANIALRGGTLMRPLVMDFRTDPEALKQKYQYMFGPALLVVPVVDENIKEQEVYLPENKGGWYDFYTGQKMEKTSGNVRVPVVMEHIPVFVKAGSVLPLSEACQYSGEVANKPWEINIYPGADGKFEVYEDEGINYEYEKGKYATFTIEWKDKQNKVILHPRKGNYSGMPVQRNLKIVKMDPTSKDGKIVKEIVYNGEKQIIKL